MAANERAEINNEVVAARVEVLGKEQKRWLQAVHKAFKVGASSQAVFTTALSSLREHNTEESNALERRSHLQRNLTSSKAAIDRLREMYAIMNATPKVGLRPSTAEKLTKMQAYQRELLIFYENGETRLNQAEKIMGSRKHWVFYNRLLQVLLECFCMLRILGSNNISLREAVDVYQIHLVGEVLPLVQITSGSVIIDVRVGESVSEATDVPWFAAKDVLKAVVHTANAAPSLRRVELCAEAGARFIVTRYWRQLEAVSEGALRLLAEASALRVLLQLANINIVPDDFLPVTGYEAFATAIAVAVSQPKRGDKDAHVPVPQPLMLEVPTSDQWTEVGFFEQCGIRTSDGKTFCGGSSKPEVYGYRWGTEAEARACGLISSDEIVDVIRRKAVHDSIVRRAAATSTVAAREEIQTYADDYRRTMRLRQLFAEGAAAAIWPDGAAFMVPPLADSLRASTRQDAGNALEDTAAALSASFNDKKLTATSPALPDSFLNEYHCPSVPLAQALQPDQFDFTTFSNTLSKSSAADLTHFARSLAWNESNEAMYFYAECLLADKLEVERRDQVVADWDHQEQLNHMNDIAVEYGRGMESIDGTAGAPYASPVSKSATSPQPLQPAGGMDRSSLSSVLPAFAMMRQLALDAEDTVILQRRSVNAPVDDLVSMAKARAARNATEAQRRSFNTSEFDHREHYRRERERSLWVDKLDAVRSSSFRGTSLAAIVATRQPPQQLASHLAIHQPAAPPPGVSLRKPAPTMQYSLSAIPPADGGSQGNLSQAPLPDTLHRVPSEREEQPQSPEGLYADVPVPVTLQRRESSAVGSERIEEPRRRGSDADFEEPPRRLEV